MIDLTPLDVRKKRGDFGVGFRGYDRLEVDGYLELVAERFEELVRENLTLKERVDRLTEQVSAFQVRERAVQDALIMAQQLRDQIQAQAEQDAARLRRETEGLIEDRREELMKLSRRRIRYLQQWRIFLERQIEELELEEARSQASGAGASRAHAQPAPRAASAQPAAEPSVEAGVQPQGTSSSPKPRRKAAATEPAPAGAAGADVASKEPAELAEGDVPTEYTDWLNAIFDEEDKNA